MSDLRQPETKPPVQSPVLIPVPTIALVAALGMLWLWQAQPALAEAVLWVLLGWLGVSLAVGLLLVLLLKAARAVAAWTARKREGRGVTSCVECSKRLATEDFPEHVRFQHPMVRAVRCLDCRQMVNPLVWAEHRRLRHPDARATGPEDRLDWGR